MNHMQRRVQDAIDERVESGAERGVQVAVYQHGELIVDAVAGVADPSTGRPVTSATVFYTYSMGKAATSTVVHLLVERGFFGYDTPIAELWPEFAAHGKDKATIRHALTHTVGVPGIPADITPPDLCDWDKMCAVIAATEPLWEPGTATGYHAYTFGYILGEVVRRATGKRISEVLREEAAEPLGIADEIYFGMPQSEHHRLAVLEDAEGSAEFLASMPDDSPFFALGPRAVTPTAELGNRSDILAADIPAGGKMSARAITRLYAALLGEVDGVRLVSEERLRTMTTPAYTGEDRLLGMPVARALGFELGGFEANPESTIFAYGGLGGTMAFADRSTGISFALAKNRLTPDFDTSQRVSEIVT